MDVEDALLGRLGLVEKADVVPPGNSCSSLLHDRFVGPGFGKGPHVLEVPNGEALDLWERTPQIGGQLVDQLGAPAELSLTLQDLPAYLPVEGHQAPVDGRCGLELSRFDPSSQGLQEGSILGRGRQKFAHLLRLALGSPGRQLSSSGQ